MTADAGNNAFFALNNGYQLSPAQAVFRSITVGRWNRSRVRYGLAAAGVIVGLITVLVRQHSHGVPHR